MNPAHPARSCATCGRPFPVPANNPRKRYCTPRCRVADWHHRHDRTGGRQPVTSPNGTADGAGNAVPNAVPAGNGVPNAVARCPHCAQPVAVISLLVAPAAVQVRVPEAPHD